MAVGYLSKALSRASPTTPSGELTGVRAATRTRSPLAEEDQRLHATPDTLAPKIPAIPLDEEPAGHMNASPNRERPVGPQIPASQELPPDPERPADAPDAASNAVSDTPNEDRLTAPQAASERGTHPQSPVPPAEPSTQEEPQADPAAPPSRPDPNAPASSSHDALSRALSQAEAWVTDGDASDPAVTHDALDSLFEPVSAVPQMSVARPPAVLAEVEPILPVQFDMPPGARPSSSPPKVEIGSIEIEIVSPPAAPKPAQAAPQRSQPVRPAPAPVAPYGWRQR